MKWNQIWHSVKRLQDGDRNIAEVSMTNGKWHVFMADGRKSEIPFSNQQQAMIAAQKAAQDTGGRG